VTERPELLDYIVFFETEPEWVHPDGWYYGMRFVSVRGADRVVATLAPDEMAFEFHWWQDGLLRTRIKSVLAGGWRLETEGQREWMEFHLQGEHETTWELQLKPHVQLLCSNTW
jgi:hypothetical protein